MDLTPSTDQPAGNWLYRAEIRGIQRWILASDRLREMKGGSAIIERLTETGARMARELGGDALVKAAGRLVASLPSLEAACAFAAHWPMWVARHAPGLELSHGLASASQGARVEMRPVRMPELPEAGPLVARAGRTGLPAVRRGKDGDEDRATAARVNVGEVDGLGDRLLDGRKADWTFLEELALFGDGGVAVIQADGNGMGARFRTLAGDLKATGELSEVLSEATLAAARAAVDGLIRATFADEDDGRPVYRVGGRRVLLARPIVLGGDDLCFLVHARYGLPFAVAFLRAFETETAARCGRWMGEGGATASAGVVFVKRSWPFHQAHALAESLCKASKDGLGRASGVAIHRVTTALSDLDWAELEERELLVPGGEGAVRGGDPGLPASLSGGPYTLNGLVALDRLARAVGDLPRGALHDWLKLLQSSPERARARWARVAEVAASGAGRMRAEQWAELRGALTALGCDPDTGFTNDGRCRTPLADALTWRAVQPDVAARLWSTP